jgi:hypothetical protein
LLCNALTVTELPPFLALPSPLAAAKARGTKLGVFRGRAGTAEDVSRARNARTASANTKAANLKPLLDRINPDGSLSLNKVARILDKERIPTASGRGTWNAKMVSLMYKRLEAA